ncbi:MAG: cyclase family protein [Candidatus Kapaibacterium sp.]
MNIIDLTHEIKDKMPVFPGDEQPSLVQDKEIERDGYSNYRLRCGLHLGTHIDSPVHFIKDAKTIKDIPLEILCGEAIVLDCRSCGIIGEKMPDIPENTHRLIICTGHYKKWEQDDYFESYPVISEEFAELLVKKGVKFVALDTPSPDKYPYRIHEILLGAELVIAENLNNTEQLIGKHNIKILALPLLINSDGAPARVFAQYDNLPASAT